MTQQESLDEIDPTSFGPDLIIITGMSGAGRTEAMHTFEDIGYFCIDNLPPSLLMNLVSLAGLNTGTLRKLAVVCDLRANFEGECSEVGMYLAMARVAHREGYPEIGMYWEKAGLEEAEHAAKFAELLGEVVTDSTQKNLQMRVDAENGATAGKFDLAKRAKALNLDAYIV